ncbi:MAG: cyclic nucleotide-binding domain-containing protein [Candidatus Sedimenticola sp. (ex Thyasira tokunagai)]
MTDITTLESIPLFSETPHDVLEELSRHLLEENFETGRCLFKEGDNATALYILLEGVVKLTVNNTGDQQTVVEMLHPGDTFLMAAILTGKPYLISAQTMTDCHLLSIPSQLLLDLIRQEGDFSLHLLAALSNQFRTMVRQIKDLRLRSTAQRLAAYLLELSVEGGGRNRLTLPYSKRLMASWLGMTPERLSRSFAALGDQGVEVSGRQIHITSLVRLRNYCGFNEKLDLSERTVDELLERE